MKFFPVLLLSVITFLSGDALADRDGHIAYWRRTKPVPAISHLPKADESQKKAMTEAVERLIREEIRQDFIDINDSFSKPLEEDFLQKLPREFAVALLNTWNGMKDTPHHMVEGFGQKQEIVANNWKILEAYCQRDLGISLEWESMKWSKRLNDLSCYINSNPQFREKIDGDRHKFLESMVQKMKIPGDTGIAGESERSAILNWYRQVLKEHIRCVLRYDLQEENFMKLLEVDLTTLSDKNLLIIESQLSKKIKQLIDKSRQGRPDSRFELNKYLIERVGLSLDEYVWKLDDMLDSESLPDLTFKEYSEMDPELYANQKNSNKRAILKKWLEEGIPDQEFPGVIEIDLR